MQEVLDDLEVDLLVLREDGLDLRQGLEGVNPEDLVEELVIGVREVVKGVFVYLF